MLKGAWPGKISVKNGHDRVYNLRKRRMVGKGRYYPETTKRLTPLLKVVLGDKVDLKTGFKISLRRKTRAKPQGALQKLRWDQKRSRVSFF